MVDSEARDCISMVLARRILDMVEQSGASQGETLAALGVVQSILPMLVIPLVNASVAEGPLPPS